MKNSRKNSTSGLLNAYQIFWGIIVIEEGKLSRAAANKIQHAAKTTVHLDWNHITFAAPQDLIDERMQATLNVLATSGVHGKMYKITDKQYGMTKNTWNGEVPECAAPFTHSIVIKDGKLTSVFAVSKDQFNNAMEF